MLVLKHLLIPELQLLKRLCCKFAKLPNNISLCTAAASMATAGIAAMATNAKNRKNPKSITTASNEATTMANIKIAMTGTLAHATTTINVKAGKGATGTTTAATAPTVESVTTMITNSGTAPGSAIHNQK